MPPAEAARVLAVSSAAKLRNRISRVSIARCWVATAPSNSVPAAAITTPASLGSP